MMRDLQVCWQATLLPRNILSRISPTSLDVCCVLDVPKSRPFGRIACDDKRRNDHSSRVNIASASGDGDFWFSDRFPWVGSSEGPDDASVNISSRAPVPWSLSLLDEGQPRSVVDSLSAVLDA